MRLKRLAMWMLVLVMVPAGGMASGSWFTVTEDLSAETLMLPNDEYTGTVTMTFLGDCTLGGEEKKAKSALSFASRIAENGMDFPFRGLKQLTEADDLTIANLEVVLSDRKLKKLSPSAANSPPAFPCGFLSASLSCSLSPCGSVTPS